MTSIVYCLGGRVENRVKGGNYKKKTIRMIELLSNSSRTYPHHYSTLNKHQHDGYRIITYYGHAFCSLKPY